MITQDPPHKKNYISAIPFGYTFNKWKEMYDYNSKVEKLNDFLQQQNQMEFQRLSWSQIINKEPLKKQQLLQEKRNNVLDYLQQQNKIDQIENEMKNSQLQNYLQLQNQIKESKDKQKENEKQKIKAEQEKELKAIEDNLNIQKLIDFQKYEKNKMNYESIAQQQKNNQEMKKIQQEQQDQEDQQNKAAYQKQQQWMVEENKKFHQKIQDRIERNELANQKLSQMNQQQEERIKSFIQNRKDFALYKEQLESEKREIEKKKLLKDVNLAFIKKQIENNKLKRDYLDFQEQKNEYLLIKERLDKENNLTSQQRKQKEKQINDILNTLQWQIQEKKEQLNHLEYMTVDEAKINDRETQNVDFKHPTSELVSGLVGHYQSKERVHQMSILQENLKLQNRYQNMQPIEERVSLIKKRYNPKQDPSFQQDDLFKNKNFVNSSGVRPYDIISGYLKKN